MKWHDNPQVDNRSEKVSEWLSKRGGIYKSFHLITIVCNLNQQQQKQKML